MPSSPCNVPRHNDESSHQILLDILFLILPLIFIRSPNSAQVFSRLATMRNLTAYHPIDGLVLADTDIGIPIPLPTSFAFLGLPSEVRLKIYRFLYRSHLPVYPTIFSKISTGSCRGVLRRTSFPTSLLLTNRQIHSEATAVIWGDNQIILQFPLNWNRERNHCSLSREGRIQPHWFTQCDTWTPSPCHLQQIRNLVIEVHLFRCSASNTPAHIPAEPAETVRKQLGAFIGELKTEHHIRNLEIRFTNILSSYNPNELLVIWKNFPAKHYSDAGGQSHLPWTDIPAVGCCSQFGKEAFGRKDLEINELEALCRQSIYVDQQVLEPLARLGGIENVQIVGRVTEEWAGFLRRSIQNTLDK